MSEAPFLYLIYSSIIQELEKPEKVIHVTDKSLILADYQPYHQKTGLFKPVLLTLTT